MKSRTKLGILVLTTVAGLVLLSHLLGKTSKTYTFNFSDGLSKTLGVEFTKSSKLDEIVKKRLGSSESNGNYSVYIENLKSGEKYGLNESEIFPAASLYKLVLLAAVMKEIEGGSLTLEDNISSTKSHLKSVFGGIDFGYEDRPEKIQFTVGEALERVGRISDNFAAIMLTEKLRAIRESRAGDNKLLISMADDLGMKNTSFDDDPISITALDVGAFFKALYNGQVVSKSFSDKIIELLKLSKINNRIPALLPKETEVVHKTGELSRVRHDAGIVYLPSKDPSLGKDAYIIVLLSKNLEHEDDGVEVLAQISKDVYEYFNK